MQLRSIVDRRENELASHAKWPILGEKTQPWAKKRNPGRKNRVSALFSERFYIEGGVEFGKFFSGWQIILLRHTGDFQKTGLLEASKLQQTLCDVLVYTRTSQSAEECNQAAGKHRTRCTLSG